MPAKRPSIKPLVILVVIATLVFIGGGLWLLHVQETGEPATAKVTSCVHRLLGKGNVSDYCTGTWVAGGSLLHGGHVVVGGTIDGASKADVGKRIDVRLRGGRAYTTSKRLPVILLVIGALFAAGGVYEVRRQRSSP